MEKLRVLALYILFVAVASEAAEIEGKVISIIDGNTFELEAEDNEVYKIILFGVDCPEPGQPFAEEAKRQLEKLIYKQNVEIEVIGKDRHGTRLGVVLIKNKIDPRKILLKNGLAWTAELNPLEELEELRLEASSKKSGIWMENNPTPPWIFRRQQSMLQPKSS